MGPIVRDGGLNQYRPYNGCYVPGQGSLTHSTDKSKILADGAYWYCWEEVYSVVGSQTFTPWTTPTGAMYVERLWSQMEKILTPPP